MKYAFLTCAPITNWITRVIMIDSGSTSYEDIDGISMKNPLHTMTIMVNFGMMMR